MRSSTQTACKMIRTLIRAPRANAFMARFVGTVRSECLDCLLIMNRRNLDSALTQYVAHDTEYRPNSSLGKETPDGIAREPLANADPERRLLRRRDRIGGLIHEYEPVA
jgi:putative transposase